MRLVHLGDGVGELAPAPILDTVHLAVAGRYQTLVALEHGWDLLALVWVNQKYDLVMPHTCSLWVMPPAAR